MLGTPPAADAAAPAAPFVAVVLRAAFVAGFAASVAAGGAALGFVSLVVDPGARGAAVGAFATAAGSRDSVAGGGKLAQDATPTAQSASHSDESKPRACVAD